MLLINGLALLWLSTIYYVRTRCGTPTSIIHNSDKVQDFYPSMLFNFLHITKNCLYLIRKMQTLRSFSYILFGCLNIHMQTGTKAIILELSLDSIEKRDI